MPSTVSMRHTRREDLVAIFTASCFVALGILFFQEAGLLTGGTTGLALLLTHLTDFSFGQLFFVLNLPFFFLSWFRMGLHFTIKTGLAIVLISVFSDYIGYVIKLDSIDLVYAGIMGGFLVGVGILITLRHRGSTGGFSILVQYLQQNHGVNAGKIQMGIDCVIVVASFFIVSPWVLVVSILGAIAVNLVLALNHRPGRYMAS